MLRCKHMHSTVLATSVRFRDPGLDSLEEVFKKGFGPDGTAHLSSLPHPCEWSSDLPFRAPQEFKGEAEETMNLWL